MNQSDKELALRFKGSLLRSGVLPSRVVVFGSRARGDADFESDLDVLVLVDEISPGTRSVISDCAWETGFEAGVVITPVVMTVDEAENSPERYSLFMTAIRNEGLTV